MVVASSEKASPTVACLGEVLIDFIADWTGPLSSAPRFRKYAGGAPANVAVGIARLGISCGFIGKVGVDPFGQFLISTLKVNGVNTEGIILTSEAPTALAFVTRSVSGDRSFFFYRNPCADILLKKNEVPKGWLEQVQFLHVGGVSLTREPSREATLYAAQYAKQHGATITFDPNLRSDLWNGGMNECKRVVCELLALTDIFLPSEEELLLLMETTKLQRAIEQVMELGPSIICVKQGAAGVKIVSRLSKGEINVFQQPAFSVEVVDTTGAGDGFNAGFISGLATNLPLSDAARQGAAVAALVITKRGAMTALPSARQLKRFLEKANQQTC